MSTMPDQSPDLNGPANSSLILLLDGQRYEIIAAELREESRRQEIIERCSASGMTPIFTIASLLDWSDEHRWTVLTLIAGIGNARVQIAEAATPSRLFEAVVEMMVGTDDIFRCQRAGQTAIETATLSHADAAQPAASRIIDRLRQLSVRGVHAEFCTGPPPAYKYSFFLASNNSSDVEYLKCRYRPTTASFQGR